MKILKIATCVFLISAVLGFGQEPPPVTKTGGLPEGQRWGETEVKNFLNLPYVTSSANLTIVTINDFKNEIETMSNLAPYEFFHSQNKRVTHDQNTGKYSFFLKNSSNDIFEVTVNLNEKKIWNTLCEDVYTSVTRAAELWNDIPTFYTVDNQTQSYTLSSKPSNAVVRWRFEKSKNIALCVELYKKTSQGNMETEADNILVALLAKINELDAEDEE